MNARQMLESLRRFLRRRNARILFLFLIFTGLLTGFLLGVFSPFHQEEEVEEAQEEPSAYEGRILRILLGDMDLTRFQLPPLDQEEIEEVFYPIGAHTTSREDLDLRQSYLLALHPPFHGDIAVEFGWNRHPLFRDWRYNPGLTYQGEETFVLASMGGRVVEVKKNGLQSYGLLLDHGADLTTRYKDLEEVFVEFGQVVERGEPIASPSTNGIERVFSFQLLEGNSPLDPLEYLRQGK